MDFRRALAIAAVCALLGCAGGTDLAVTTFTGGTGTDSVGSVSIDPATSDASASETSDSVGADSSTTTDDADTSGTTGDDCLDEEICDGIDNTCDNGVDEGCICEPGQMQVCYSGPEETLGVGVCMAGTQLCGDDGQWEACEDEVTPFDESCNGVDDDCDDAIDEGFESQMCGEGICQVTVQTCQDGVPQRCIPGEPADDEACNGVDDTCDGDVDEGCSCNDGDTQPCYGGPMGTQDVGVCQGGTQTCTDGAWGECEGDVLPAVEGCDGVDNDCDMAADEGNPGGGAACATGFAGVCSLGHQQCIGGALSCVQDVQASAETCDGLDNDCDSGTDEGNPGGGGNCNTGLLGACAAGTNQCMNGALQCVQNVAQSTEACDAVDNDCDGSNNEGNPGGGQGCVTGQPGVCSAGTTQCSGGVVVCNANLLPSGEICDGLDNDCDSGTDEGNPGGGAACATGLLGPCATGAFTCSGGVLGCAQTVFPVAEVCNNGGDEDCDGSPDDGCGCSHGVCVQGVALVPGCSACVTEICGVDAFCCNNSWDAVCVAQVATVCADTQCNSCAHSVCVTGVPLVSTCDSATLGCAGLICAQDPFCCSTNWDAVCVNQVSLVCGLPC